MGVEVRRGDHVAIVLTASGEVRFFADRRSSGAASSNSPVKEDGAPSPSAQEDLLEDGCEEQDQRGAVVAAGLESLQLDASDLTGETGAASSDSLVQENGKPRPTDASGPDGVDAQLAAMLLSLRCAASLRPIAAKSSTLQSSELLQRSWRSRHLEL